MATPSPFGNDASLPVACLPARVEVARCATRVRAGVLTATTMLATAVACAPSPDALANGEDPLAALRSPVASARYTAGYWYEQARADAAGRWRRATEYCGEEKAPPGLETDGARPNCRAVWSAHFRLAQEQQVRDLNARVNAEQARERTLTSGQRKAAFDSQLFKP